MSLIDFLPFRIPLRALKAFGLWRSKKSREAFPIYGILLHIFLTELFLVFQILFLFKMKTFHDFTRIVTVLPVSMMITLRSWNFYYKSSEIEALFEEIHEILNDDQTIMKLNFKNRLEKTDKVFKFLLAFAVICSVSTIFVPFVYHELPMRMWFPFTYESNNGMFWAGAIYQVVCAFYTAVLDVVLNVFSFVSMMCIVEMLEKLNEKIDRLKKQKTLNPDGSINILKKISNTEKLVDCIKYHQKIIEATKKVQSLFSFTFLSSGLQSTLVICMTSFILTNVRTLTSKNNNFMNNLTLRFLYKMTRLCLWNFWDTSLLFS